MKLKVINKFNHSYGWRNGLMGFMRKLQKNLQIARADEIARRYLVMNGFDGALTTLGVIMGAYFAGLVEAKIILSAGLGASMAMGISGAWGAYMAEKAERTRSIKELEKALFTSLENSVIERSSRIAITFIAFIDALSPVCASIISLSPFILSLTGILSTDSAITLAFILNMATLFSLGIFLGRISKTSIWLHGGLMVLAGFLIMLFVFLIGAIP